jgi:hypothetical protein
VIVRILGEGQYRLDDDARQRVNDLDNEIVGLVQQGDEEGFHESFDRLLDLIRTEGRALADDELEESDVLVPPADTSFTEAQQDESFAGEGLIPD